ncbi:MAG TPA: SMP-30/gluconolactonase/LRE family protein [Terriglobales bacterium]|nr:SMP-30/gluconolactonase/LRE family protein [Terriglobales bacterium]
MSLRTSPFTEIAAGLAYPEGPVYLPDGSLAAVEVKGGNLRRFRPDPATGRYLSDPPLALGGAPNGAALGPDGNLYVCNNGGMDFLSVPVTQDGNSWTLNVPGAASPAYNGGYLQRVTLATGAVETLCTGFRSPDDLVFDAAGGLWFTDWGKLQSLAHGPARDITGVYYLPAGASAPMLTIPNRSAPNGILLSPGGDRVYVAETYNRWIVYWELDGPGKIRPNPRRFDGSHLLTAAIPGCGGLDSMAMDEAGNLYAITILPHGLDPLSRGGITVVSPKGEILEYITLDCGIPDPLPSNLCFGGPGRRTAFITLGGTGRILACQMAIPGLPSAHP